MTILTWRRRQCCAALLGAGLAALQGSPLQAQPISLDKDLDSRDFVAVLNLRTGKLKGIAHLDQAAQIDNQPGSILKLATAAAALEAGITNPARRITCPGWYQSPAHTGLGRLPCWDYRGHGSLTLKEAIARSCNVHFYHLGAELGSERVLQGLKRFGFGSNLTAGIAPLLATGEDPQLRADPWLILELIASIALRGKGISIQVPERTTLAAIDLPSSTWDLLRAGMMAATTQGTCRGIAPKGVSVAAKTGTVINLQSQAKRLALNAPLQAEDFQAWLGAFWPVDSPNWAMVMHLQRGKAYEVAIPVARRIIDLINHS